MRGAPSQSLLSPSWATQKRQAQSIVYLSHHICRPFQCMTEQYLYQNPYQSPDRLSQPPLMPAMIIPSTSGPQSMSTTFQMRLQPQIHCVTRVYHSNHPLFPLDFLHCTSLIFSPHLHVHTDKLCSAPPNVYLMITAISAGNEHRRVGSVHSSVVLTLAPGELSTIEGHDEATRAYNFADLPCPPSDVASRNSLFYNPKINPTQPYRPRISIPSAAWKLDPAWSTCTHTAPYEGFDPPTILSPATSISGPKVAFPPGYFRRGATGPLQSPTYANIPGAYLVPPTALPTTVTTNSPSPMGYYEPARTFEF